MERKRTNTSPPNRTSALKLSPQGHHGAQRNEDFVFQRVLLPLLYCGKPAHELPYCQPSDYFGSGADRNTCPTRGHLGDLVAAQRFLPSPNMLRVVGIDAVHPSGVRSHPGFNHELGTKPKLQAPLPDFFPARHGVRQEEHHVAQRLRPIHLLWVGMDRRPCLRGDQSRERLNFGGVNVANPKNLIGDVVLFHPVKVPDVDILHAELRQGEGDARAGRAGTDHVNSPLAEGRWREDRQVPDRVNLIAHFDPLLPPVRPGAERSLTFAFCPPRATRKFPRPSVPSPKWPGKMDRISETLADISASISVRSPASSGS